MPILPGQTLGNYRIVEQIGQGGMATVYKGHHAALSRDVAIKILPAFYGEGSAFFERFRQEAVTVARLRHPNIPSVYDYGEEDGITYIVSEYVDGGTLAALLGTPMPPADCLRYLRPIAAALDYAHSRGVIHRDVKPSNVLLSRDGTPMLSDFGIARMVSDAPGLTRTGASVGTPEYMAPEQAMQSNLGPATDVYALAVMAYQMLTGGVPFADRVPLAVILAHLHEPVPLPRDRNPAISEAVQDVLLKGLAKQPEDRYQFAGQMVEELELAIGGAVDEEAAIPTLIETEPVSYPDATLPGTPEPAAPGQTALDVSTLPATPTAISGYQFATTPEKGTLATTPPVLPVAEAETSPLPWQGVARPARKERPKPIGTVVAVALAAVALATGAVFLIARSGEEATPPGQGDRSPRSQPTAVLAVAVEPPGAAACLASDRTSTSASAALREGAPARAREMLAEIAGCPGLDISAQIASIDLLLGARDAQARGDFDVALRLARDLARADPQFPGLSDTLYAALVGAGQAAILSGDTTRALALCSEAQAARPGGAEAGACLAQARPTSTPFPTAESTAEPIPTTVPPTAAPTTLQPTAVPATAAPATLPPTQRPPTAPPIAPLQPPIPNPSPAEDQLLSLINESRAEAGLPALTWDPSAGGAARAHSEEMAERGFFDSKNPEGLGAVERLRTSGATFSYWAENLSAGRSVAAAHAGDMGAESSRRNILDPRVGRVGIGIARRADQVLLITVVFLSR